MPTAGQVNMTTLLALSPYPLEAQLHGYLAFRSLGSNKQCTIMWNNLQNRATGRVRRLRLLRPRTDVNLRLIQTEFKAIQCILV
jgi:hypothetical protein